MDELVKQLAEKANVDVDAAQRVLGVLGAEAVDKKLANLTSGSGIDSFELGDLKLAVRVTASDAIV